MTINVNKVDRDILERNYLRLEETNRRSEEAIKECNELLDNSSEQIAFLLEKLDRIHTAINAGKIDNAAGICMTIWDRFDRAVVKQNAEYKLDLTPDAMLKERIESYTIKVDSNPVEGPFEAELAEIISPKTEPTVEDVFGDTPKDNKYWIVVFKDCYQIKSDTGSVLRFDKTDEKAKRKADLALKLLNQAEPDDIDLLIEMLY